MSAVALPPGEDTNEWIASNSTFHILHAMLTLTNVAVDFFNEVSLIWGIVGENGLPQYAPGEGFPAGFEYLWADGVTIRTPIKCSSTEYVEYVMTWVEDQINNESLFPSSSGTFCVVGKLCANTVQMRHFRVIIWL